MASSCTGGIKRTRDFIEQIPCGPRIGGGDRLDGVANMLENMIADGNMLISEQGQADITTHTFGLTTGKVTCDENDASWDSETHASPPSIGQKFGVVRLHAPDSENTHAG
jgi:hypothetical protein